MFKDRKRGERTDLSDLHKKIVKEGFTVEDLVKDEGTFPFMVHYGLNITRIVSVSDSMSVKEAPVVHVYTGLPHTGIF